MPADFPFGPAASLQVLKQRAFLLRELRSFFHSQGYWEVETPVLSNDTCVDLWLDPFEVQTPCRRFLQTSPEFAMKRLLASGADSIFQVTKSFRSDEVGRRHNPEFTIVEWYRVGATYHEQMDFTEQLVRHLQTALATLSVSPPKLGDVIPRFTYDQAFEAALRAKVLHLTDTELRDLAAAHLGAAAYNLAQQNRDSLLNLLLAEIVEPWLESQQACFLCDFPASQAALARVRPNTPPVAERFELYLGELEICNGYQELTDPVELRRRNAAQNALRGREGKPELPSESCLLSAMDSGLPECSGVALGFDRLLMWLLGAHEISQVMAFPWPID
ncbi:MAG: EF-P lysine aminoacylase GenX [Planctomycetaceae bacterium]|nr:EF-P lysine aminoacylase GenX [Planctomycetaceae bacterium]